MAIPGELIPIMGIGVALVAVTGRVIIQPIVNAVMRLSEQQRSAVPPDVSALEQRMRRMEERLAGMETSMDRMLADRDFYLQLQSGKRAAPPPSEG